MTELQAKLELTRQRVKGHAALIDQAGRHKLTEVLRNSIDPFQSISDLQSSWSLNFPRASPALSFLDVLQCSRSNVYQSLLENLKARLENQLNNISDETKLIIMLKETIKYMYVKDLKQVPISIIKRLSSVPEVYLNHLARYGFLMVGVQIHKLLNLHSPSYAWEYVTIQ